MKKLSKNWLLPIKNVLVTCCIASFPFFSNAQLNLVPDPSFEDIDTIPGGLGQMDLKLWNNLDSTKLYVLPFCYFSTLAWNLPYRLPNSQWCYQLPRNGEGVIVLDFTWVYVPNIQRLFTRTKLKSNLIAGKTYCAKMYVNPCDKYYGYFTDGISMYFDNGQLDTIVAQDSSGIYPFVQPQVSNPQGNVLTDTMNWTLVSGTFVATGTETFLTIGNFKTDSATTRVFNPATFVFPDTIRASALLIDDVSVIPIDAHGWLSDVWCTLGDSTTIGMANYEAPDAAWYTYNMQYIGKGSELKVLPTQGITQYIQAIDVCNSIIYDTLTVYASPLGVAHYNMEESITIIPNPVSSKFQIINSKFQSTKELYNSVGQLLFSTKENEIEVSKFAKGVYYLKCGNITRKLVVE